MTGVQTCALPIWVGLFFKLAYGPAVWMCVISVCWARSEDCGVFPGPSQEPDAWRVVLPLEKDGARTVIVMWKVGKCVCRMGRLLL